MSDEVQICTLALHTLTLQQEKEETSNKEEEDEEEEEEDPIDVYDPGETDPYTREYIFKYEPFRYIPNVYYPEPDERFLPPCLVVGVGLLRDEAIAYAEEHGIVPSGSKYTPTDLFFAYEDMASHFAKLYGCRMQTVNVLSRKCDIVLALFHSYSRPDNPKSRRKLRDVMEKLIKIFPAAHERCGWFYWAMNDSMYPEGYSPLMYKE